jgi:hypothetical protein
MEAYARLGNQKAAAHELGISCQTLKNHLSSLYYRLNVGGAMEALHALGWIIPATTGVPPCGWVAYCGRPAEHRGNHGRFHPLLRRDDDA